MKFHPKEVWSSQDATLDMPELSVMAKSMIAARRALHGPLPADLIHDPALDLLLSLFLARPSDRRLTAETLIGRTSVAASVARRWIDVLDAYGLVERDRTGVALTQAGADAVAETLRAVAASQWHLQDIE